MIMEMKLEILSRETIKPLSPTPPDLKTHLLSSFDQQSHLFVYIQNLYFYNNNNYNNSEFSSQLLKNSLSKTLVRYYPFAGRLGNGPVFAIDCNDEGVSFLEAKILNCVPMSEIVNRLKTKCDYAGISELLFSDNLQGKDQRFNPLLSVQITHFDCGGIVIAIFMSHILADMTTFVNFMNDWASIARTTHCSGDNDNVFSVSPPRFDTASFFPQDELEAARNGNAEKKQKQEEGEGIVGKRFEIDGSQIARLKGIVGEKVENPSRVQVVTALIFKALRNIYKKHPTTLLQTINLRSRFVPSLPENLTGNIGTFFIGLSTSSIEEEEEEEETERWKLVGDLKKNLEKFCNKYPRKYKKPEEWSSLYKSHIKEILDSFSNPPNQKVYVCTSWCRFPSYQTDFGYGKPIWVTVPLTDVFMKNQFLLMDTKDGDGIEVSILLDTKEMADFETSLSIIQHQLLK